MYESERNYFSLNLTEIANKNIHLQTEYDSMTPKMAFVKSTMTLLFCKHVAKLPMRVSRRTRSTF